VHGEKAHLEQPLVQEGLYLRVRLVASQPYAMPGGSRLWFVSAWLAGEIPARIPLTYREAKKSTNVRDEIEKSFDLPLFITLSSTTMAEYSGLAVSRLNLLKQRSVDQREFDLLMERFLTECGTFVVDTGASTFIPLWHYFLENQALDYLRERGKRVFIDSVITGGQSLNDTLTGIVYGPHYLQQRRSL